MDAQARVLRPQSHAAAIDTIERVITDERIDCDFLRLDGYLFVPPGDDLSQLEREFAAAQRAGLDVSRVARAPVSFDTGPALRNSRGRDNFTCCSYLRGAGRGGESQAVCEFSTSTQARKITGGKKACVETSGGIDPEPAPSSSRPIRRSTTCVAIHTKQAAYRTFVVGAVVPRGSIAPLLLWDTPDPYHYVRIQPGATA